MPYKVAANPANLNFQNKNGSISVNWKNNYLGASVAQAKHKLNHYALNNDYAQEKQRGVTLSSQRRDVKSNNFCVPQKVSGKGTPCMLQSLPKPLPVISKSNFPKPSLKNDPQKKDSNQVQDPSNKSNEKQGHVMKDHSQNTPRFLTTSITNLVEWEDFREKITLMFEVFGTLESAVSTNTNNSKTFILKDDTGSIRCTFWEMDRTLPRLIRGKIYRCTGSLDRKGRSFNCVTVRPSTLAEVNSSKISNACTQVVMQAYIATFRED